MIASREHAVFLWEQNPAYSLPWYYW